MIPLVSIIISAGPNRDNIILGSLQSLLDKTKDHSRLEIILNINSDDLDTEKAVSRYLTLLPLKIIKNTSVLKGSDLALFANQSAAASTGKFIWYWTDEARMITPDWDEYLSFFETKADKFTLIFPLRKNMIGDIYPMISRKWYQTTGRFAGHMAHDCWCDVIAKTLPGIVEQLSLSGLEMENSTTMRRNPEYEHFPSPKVWESDEIQSELKKDIEKIRIAFNQK